MKLLSIQTVLFVIIAGCSKPIPKATAVVEKPGTEREATAGTRLNADQAGALEKEVAEHPDDLSARTKLLGYYTLSRFTSGDAKKAYRAHVLWVIKNRPDSEIAGTPSCSLDPILDADGYQAAKEAWVEQTKNNPKNAVILSNAAQLFFIHEPAQAEPLLKSAAELEPSNPKRHDQLGHLYALQFGQEHTKALAEFEKAQAIDTDNESKTNRLEELAKMAYTAGDMDKAAQYADEFLKTGTQNPKCWYYGNAIHHGNNILGRIALKQGHVQEAEAYLLKAGQTPGSPQLNSFGPNMSLALELLQKGEKDPVLQYFTYCRTFWQMGGDRLDDWTKQVKDGKVPEFGANLVY